MSYVLSKVPYIDNFCQALCSSVCMLVCFSMKDTVADTQMYVFLEHCSNCSSSKVNQSSFNYLSPIANFEDM